MLTYTPALDPYHTAFRFVSILSGCKGQVIGRDKLRILDFYLSFPESVWGIRLSLKDRALAKKLEVRSNRYVGVYSPRLTFRAMSAAQLQALHLLAAREWIDRSELLKGFVHPAAERFAPDVIARIQQKDENWYLVWRFIVERLSAYPLLGANGLKDRTGLMEHRYDEV